MRYIKLFEKFETYSRVVDNIQDMFLELEDKGIQVTVYNTEYTQEFIDKHAKNLLYFNKGNRTNLYYFIKEPCELLTIYASGVPGEDWSTEFVYSEEYNDSFEMANEYIKEIYNLSDDDIFYTINNTYIYHLSDIKDILVDNEKFTDLRANYIIRGNIF